MFGSDKVIFTMQYKDFKPAYSLAAISFILILTIFINGCVMNNSVGKNTTIANNESTNLNNTGNIKNASLKGNKTNNDSQDQSTKRYCDIDPQSGKPVCYCEPLANKNKVAVIFAKNGIYDTETVSSHVLQYYGAVKSDLDLESAGLQKFDGKTMDDLESFIDSLYLNNDVGYIILLGDDMPVTDLPREPSIYAEDGSLINPGVTYDLRNLAAIHEKLEYVNKSKWGCPDKSSNCFENCNDVAISLIVPPDPYSSEEKVGFILKILETYTNYHNNFTALIAEYQKSVLFIYDPTFSPTSEYDIPGTIINNTDGEGVTSEMKLKHVILALRVHGSQTSVGMGLGSQYTTQQDYSNFVKENGLPSLFVDSSACQSVALKMENVTYCCWPQIYLESGVWVYYIINSDSNKVRKTFPHEETLGMTIRKNLIGQNYIFGDILAHIQ